MQAMKAILLLACCFAVARAQTTFPSLVDAVAAANASAPQQMSILLAAVQAAGVAGSLGPNTTWTILAPTNNAFVSRLNESLGITPQELLLPENRDVLVEVLSYHVIPSGAVLSSQLTDGQEAPTALAEAAPLTVSIANGNVTFEGANNNAAVTTADIEAGSSVIHIIDDVLLPAGIGNFPNATNTTGPVVYESIAAALEAANGTNSSLSILLAAVEAAGVGANLTNDTAWTILAPTNDAFVTRLNDSVGITPEQLLLPENRDTLVQVLSYQVIPSGAVLSSQLTDGQEAPTALAEAAPLTVSIANGTVTFVGGNSNASVTTADIQAGASVIHVIDDVLLPAGVGTPEVVPTVDALQGAAAPATAAAPAVPAGPAQRQTSGASTTVSSVFWMGAALAIANALL
uniref:Astaxanthin-binding orange protein of fasciclin family n=1 Tax=Scenedesmus sp. Oki-4N TaxID=2650458 RepID=A0A7G1GEX6_9CHLO|nr:astaxanthin-binding orange protein of fasciclin family [Scenedesmus sp. Oki-4N]